MKPRDYYAKKSRTIIKRFREEQQLEYSELNKRLRDHGVVIDTKILINRINRGNFSFTFAMQVLAALGIKTLDIPNVLNDAKNAAVDAGPFRKMDDPKFEWPEMSD